MLEQLESDLRQSLINNNRIGIFVSGGIDSGFLFYLCAKIIYKDRLTTELMPFIIAESNLVKNPNGMVNNELITAKLQTEWINKKFNAEYRLGLLTWHRDPNQFHSLKIPESYINISHICKTIILGDTKNPDHLIGETGEPQRSKSSNKNIIQPLINFTKDRIIKGLIDLKADYIIQMSSSCFEYTAKACGHCWNCRERAWAFESNNIIDIGLF